MGTQMTELREILVGYLLTAGCLNWPGGDGLTVDAVLLSYPANAAQGRVPNQEELRARHPGLRDAVQRFFATTRHQSRDSVLPRRQR